MNTNLSNYRSLISSMGGGSNLSWLSDYASIKNGSYGKLMKQYYAQNPVKGTDATTGTTQTKKAQTTESVAQKIISEKTQAPKAKTESEKEESAYNKITKATGALQDSVTKMQTVDLDDEEKAVKAAQEFVKSYNDTMSAAAKVDDKSIASRVTSIEGNTKAYSKSLEKIGITVDAKDGTMKLDEDKFKAADKSSVEGIFAKRSSYAYSLSVSAGMMGSNASYAASKNALYTDTGKYSQNAAGTLYNSYF